MRKRRCGGVIEITDSMKDWTEDQHFEHFKKSGQFTENDCRVLANAAMELKKNVHDKG